MANDRDQVAMSTGLDAKHAKTILGIMERDALNEARQYFLCRGLLLRLHPKSLLGSGLAITE